MAAGAGPLGSRDGVRALFLILAGSVAAAVAALLVGPRLVDGELARQQLLDRLEAATGQPARVLGSTSLSLLPEPRLSLGELVVGDLQRGALLATVERVDLVLGLGGLLGAGSGLREVRLVRPQLRALGLAEPGALADLLERLRTEELPVDTLSVVGGRVSARDPSLPAPLELAGIDLEVARETGGGPLVLTGGGRWNEQPVAVELELRPASAGPHALRLQLAVGSGATASRLGYRGGIDVVRGRPRLDGEIELAADSARLAELLARLGAGTLAERLPPLGPFAARGRLRLDESRLETDRLRVATGAGELALRLALGLALPRSLALELEAGRLELPATLDPTARLAALWAGPPEDLVGSVQARIGVLARAGEELRLVRLDARLPGGGALELDGLGAELPGTGDLELQGRLARGPAGPLFRGRLALRLEDPRPVLAWLGLEPGLPAARLGAVGLAGELAATPEGLSLAEAEIRLAGARGRGTAALLHGPPPRLRLVGRVDRLTLDPWLDGPAVAAWLGSGPPDGVEAELDLALDRLAWRGLRGEQVRLRGELARGVLRIDELASAELGGAAARLAGSLGPGGASDLALELAAEQPARLARALELDPGPWALLDGPVRGRAALREDARGRRLEAELLSAEGGIRAEIGLLRGSLEAERASLAAELRDLATLAARLGGPGTLAPGLAGPLAAQGRAERTSAGWRIAGRVGAGRLALEAGLELAEAHGTPLLRGRLALERADAQSLADLYRLLELPLGLPGGPLRGWPGAWPRRPFAPPRLPPADLDLALELGLETAEGTPLGRGGATLAFAGRALALDGIDLPLAGGRLTGRLLAELGAGSGRVEAELALASAALPTLAEALRGGEPGSGTLDLELAASSEGRSPAELVANLTGRGTLTLRELAADGLAAAPGSPEPLLLRGPLVVERGVARAETLAVEGPGEPMRAALAFDLAAWILDLELQRPAGRLRLLGPPDRLRRYEGAGSGAP